MSYELINYKFNDQRLVVNFFIVSLIVLLLRLRLIVILFRCAYC